MEIIEPRIRENEQSFGSPEQNYRVYSRLADLMLSGKHGERWEIRPFSPLPEEAEALDPFGLLKLDQPFVPIRESGRERRLPFKEFASILILPESIRKFANGYEHVMDNPMVAEHLDWGGSAMFVVGPHKSYADLPVSASIAAQRSRETARNQTVFIHRQVALQKIGRLLVVDDGMLRTGNILQTFPDSKSGTDEEFADIRERANRLAMKSFLHLIQKGGQTFWVNLSGSETMPSFDAETRASEQVMGRASDGSSGLMHIANRKKDRLLAIPYAMDIDPFKPGGGFEPHEVPFEFLEPRFIHDGNEVHAMMEEIAAVYNHIKRPEIPPARYETADEYRQRMAA